jgi:hypothetical protein
MEIFDFFIDLFKTVDLLATLSMHLEFMALEGQLSDDDGRHAKYFDILTDIDPYNLKRNFKATVMCFIIVMVVHVITSKVFNYYSLHVASAWIELILLMQLMLSCGSLFICIFQGYEHMAIDGRGYFDYFVEPRAHIALYYAVIFGSNFVTMTLEFIVFFFLLPQLMEMHFVSLDFNFPVFCGCGECYTMQKPLTEELLKNHVMLYMRPLNVDSGENSPPQLSYIKTKIYNTGECSICLQDFTDEFDEKDTRVLICGHKFHAECLHLWVLKEWHDTKLINMHGMFERVRTETNLEPQHGMIYSSYCPDCRFIYGFILCKGEYTMKQ